MALRFVSHPAAAFPGQCAYPGLQANVHVPFVQARPVAATCESIAQSLLQSPHVWTSFTDTHPAAHRICPAPHAPEASGVEGASSSLASAPIDPSAMSSPPARVASPSVPASFGTAPADEKSPSSDVHPATGDAAASATAATRQRQNPFIVALRSGGPPTSPTSKLTPRGVGGARTQRPGSREVRAPTTDSPRGA